MTQPAVLINCFEVPAGREEEFLALWREVNTYMRNQPGYRRHSLHKSLAPFVNIAAWDAPAALAGAHDEHFRSLVSAAKWRDFPSTPGAYETVHTGAAPDSPSPAATTD